MKFGEAIHAAVPWILAENDLNKAYSEFCRVWEGSLLAGVTEDEKRNTTSAKLMLIDYAESHRPGLSLFTIKKPPTGDLAVDKDTSPWEIPWAIDLGLDVPLVGRIDALCEHRDTKELFGLEFKTSSEMSARLVTGFEMNTQVTGYTLALRTYTQQPVAGIMLDLIGVKKNKQETFTHPIRVQNFQLEDFISWARFWGEFILSCEKTGDFPKWYTGCTPYQQFGMPGFTCEFKHLCSVPDWTTMLPFYSKREDRPFDLATVKIAEVPKEVKI